MTAARRTTLGTRILGPATGLIAALLVAAPAPRPAAAADAQELTREGRQSLAKLTAHDEAAQLLAGKAVAVLVFPHMLKAGFMFGGQIGEGVMLRGGRPVGYYNSVSASYGFQAGVQRFGYALFFMNEAALEYLDKSEGFEIGVGPSVVVVDAGLAKSMTSTTLSEDVYAFVFDQTGLMAGLGIQGTKITRISK